MSKKSLIPLAVLAAAAMELSSGIDLTTYKMRGPKNKYNLTEEEIEMMSTMTPKQKKQFLRGRTNGRS